MTKKKLAEHEVYNQVLGKNATRKVTIIFYPKFLVASTESVINGKTLMDYRKFYFTKENNTRDKVKEEIKRYYNIK